VRVRFCPNINWVRAVVCPAVVFIAMNMDRGYQTDFWHHLARGRAIAEAGRVVDVEQFTFTVAGTTVRDANWLTQLAYFRLFELGGMPLVQFANAALLAGAAAVLVWLCRRRSGSIAAASAVGVFAFAGIWQTLLVRPQSASLLLFVVLYAVLLEAERRRWLLALLPVMMALWANVHGGFPIGLVLIGAFLAGTVAERWAGPLWRRLSARSRSTTDPAGATDVPAWHPVDSAANDKSEFGLPFAESSHRPPGDAAPIPTSIFTVRGSAGMIPALLACLLVSTLATLLNPYGHRVYEYVFTLSTLAAGRQIEEWLPPSMNLWVGRAWAASILLLIALLASARRKPRPRDLFVPLCFLPLACASVRMVPWWLLAVAPVLSALLRDVLAHRAAAAVMPVLRGDGQGGGRFFLLERNGLPPRPGHPVASEQEARARPALSALAMLVLILGSAVLSTPWFERFNPVLGSLRPDGRPEAQLQLVVDRMNGAPHGSRVFTRLEWGEYLDWAAHPRCRTFMDGRIEIYPDAVWREYHAVNGARADWQDILDAHRVDYLLLDAGYHAELLPHVRASAAWEPVGGAGPALLFARRAGADDGLATTDFHDAR
jgi:hypothetical protein